MNNQSGFTVIELLIVFVLALSIGSWIYNGFKLASCDFESSYKCEVIHGAGLIIPPISVITVWFETDQ